MKTRGFQASVRASRSVRRLFYSVAFTFTVPFGVSSLAQVAGIALAPPH